MRILLLTTAFNSLTQRLFSELRERGHDLAVEFDINNGVTREAVALFRPDLIVAPFLKRRVPEDVWRTTRTLIIHPGPPGDRGPSALDWAVLEQREIWGVTVLEARAEFDAGPIWAARSFAMRATAKGSLYRNEITEAAVAATLEALDRIAAGAAGPRWRAATPPPLRERPLMRQSDRTIDWSSDTTDRVLAKIRAADGVPGVRDHVEGRSVYLFDAHAEDRLSGVPGTFIAARDGALCRATVDGAVWIGHMKADRGDHPALKLPAQTVLPSPNAVEAGAPPPGRSYRQIWYEEDGAVGYLHFPFYNGAMSSEQCERLRVAYGRARGRPTKVIVLMGGPDFWSNGIHLNVIEAAASPAEESWRNINAIDDLVRDVIETNSHLVIAAMRGNAGAGGVFMALAADRVVARSAIVLNPHYKGMGNLYGSEYWTYLLPKRVGAANAEAITEARLPMGTPEARCLGLIDDTIDGDVPCFDAALRHRARDLAKDPAFDKLLVDKRRQRIRDEAHRQLAAYRADELDRMKRNFFGFDPSYHVARYNFVYKVPKSRTPLSIAPHRRLPRPTRDRQGCRSLSR